MRTRLPFLVFTGALVAVSAAAQDPHDRDPKLVIREQVRDVIRSGRVVTTSTRTYQGRDRGPEQTERFSRRAKLGRDGRFTVENIAGDITVTGGSGDEVSIEAVKRTRGGAAQLATVQIIVDERTGRVDVRTDHTARQDRVSVDFTITVPGSASVDAKSVSGSVKVSNVQGAVRAETISGNVTTAATPKLQMAKSVSGDVNLTELTVDSEVVATNISGHIRARGLKARALDVGTVTGDIILTDITCDRVGAKSVSGSVEYSGTLARSGRYDFNVHSGNIRVTLAGSTGFAINANTFSGVIRSDLPLTNESTDRRTDRRRMGPGHAIRGVFGDGSASLTVRTFSGNITVSDKR